MGTAQQSIQSSALGGSHRSQCQGPGPPDRTDSRDQTPNPHERHGASGSGQFHARESEPPALLARSDGILTEVPTASVSSPGFKLFPLFPLVFERYLRGRFFWRKAIKMKNRARSSIVFRYLFICAGNNGNSDCFQRFKRSRWRPGGQARMGTAGTDGGRHRIDGLIQQGQWINHAGRPHGPRGYLDPTLVPSAQPPIDGPGRTPPAQPSG